MMETNQANGEVAIVSKEQLIAEKVLLEISGPGNVFGELFDAIATLSIHFIGNEQVTRVATVGSCLAGVANINKKYEEAVEHAMKYEPENAEECIRKYLM